MMNSQDIPPVSNKTLFLATVSALVISSLIFIIVVLPAEYGKDPTGLGKRLGLTALSGTEPVTEPLDSIETTFAGEKQYQFREDNEVITIPANKGIEYKFKLNAFDQLKYEWKTTDGSPIYFDFHGEPAGDTTGYFLSYGIGTAIQMEGTSTVPFDGIHGWYWKNTSDQIITVQLKTSGNYQVHSLKK